MNKEELINQVVQKTGGKKMDVRNTVDVVFDAITDALAKGQKFQYIGFGSFGVKKRAGRNGVNPRTREKIKIKEKKVAYFTPGKQLAEKVSHAKMGHAHK
ncbi:MAG: HU family DNA-binding protein [Candidatus Xenobia bacterium]